MAKGKEATKEVEFGGEGVEFDAEGDDSLLIDLNDVEDSDFEPLPKGMYNVVLEDLEYKMSESAGNPMWTWTLEVEDGDFQGRKLFMHTVFQGKGLPITKRAIAQVFPHLMQGAFNPQEVAESGNLLGARMRARVGQQMYDGRKTNNVKGVFAAADPSDF